MKTGKLYLAALAAALFITATLQAQPWKPAGPDDGNQPMVYAGFTDLSMASDKGKGFYMMHRQYVWSSPTTAEQRVSVRHWDGTNWTDVGAPGISAGGIDYMNLAVAPGPVPYLVYQDQTMNNMAVVKTFNGTSWQNVGLPVSPALAQHCRIAIDNTGAPVVAYIDAAIAPTIVTVKKWDGVSWQTIGTDIGLTANVQNLKLAIGVNGLPQVLILHNAGGTNSAELYRYTGSSWANMGTIASGVNIETISLALMKHDTAMVAYTDIANNRRLNVRKYNGSSWVQVGAANFSEAACNNLQLVIDTVKGTYLFCNTDFKNGTNPTMPMLRRFDGTNWAIAGPDTFIVRRHSYSQHRFVLDTAGVPHALVMDIKGALLKLDNNTWAHQGTTPGITNGIATSVKLEAAPDGKKAYAITGGDYLLNEPYNTRIYEYDAAWTEIGRSGLAGLKGMATDIAVHNNGEPWIALRDSGSFIMYEIWKRTNAGWVKAGLRDTAQQVKITMANNGDVYVSLIPMSPSYGIQVHKYDGNTWTQLPSLKPNGAFRYFTLKVNSVGVPYVLGGSHISTHPNYLYAFQVHSFNGSSWVDVGPIFNTANGTYYEGDPDLEIDSLDVPHVAFLNTSLYELRVQKYDAPNFKWVDVVTAMNSPTYASYPDIRFAPDGTLYASYGDRSVSPQASFTVKRLSGALWQTVGDPAFVKGTLMSGSLALLNNRMLAAYSDGAVYAYKYECAQPANISLQPADSIACSGSNAIFTVSGTGISAYRWQYDNGNGWNNVREDATYGGVYDDTLVLTNVVRSLDGIRFRCVVSNSCYGTNFSEDAVLRVDTNNWANPLINISANVSTTCSGKPVTFRATTVNAGVLFGFEWLINSTPVNGATDSLFTTTTLAPGDVVSCRLTRKSACGLPPASVVSTPATVTIISSQPAVVNINAAPGTFIAPGHTVTFTATVANGGVAPQYQWLLNGSPIAGANAATYVSSTLANGDVVSCEVKRADTCATPATVVSNTLTITHWANNISDAQKKGSISVYPQPANGAVTISGLEHIAAGRYTLQLADVMGRKVYEEQLEVDSNTPTHSIALPASIPAGTYRLGLYGSQQVATATVLIAR